MRFTVPSHNENNHGDSLSRHDPLQGHAMQQIDKLPNLYAPAFESMSITSPKTVFLICIAGKVPVLRL